MPGVVLDASAKNSQDRRLWAGTVPEEHKVPGRLHVQIDDLQRDDGALLGRDHVQALQAAGVLAGVVGTGQNLRKEKERVEKPEHYSLPSRPHLRPLRGHELAPAALSLGPPAGPEALLLDAAVAPELDHHEVGGGDVRSLGDAETVGLLFVSVAAQRRQIDRRVLGATAAQDLDSVEVLLRVELGELRASVKRSDMELVMEPPNSSRIFSSNIFDS